MEMQFQVSNISTSLIKTYTQKKDKSIKSSADLFGLTEDHREKKDSTVGNADIGSIKTDPRRIDLMTVKELRMLSRNVGISTKGSKKDLVAALKCFLPDVGGDIADEAVRPKQKPMSSKSTPLKTNAKSTTFEETDEGVIVVSELPENTKRSRRKRKSVETISWKDDSGKVLIGKEEVLDAKTSQPRKRVSTKVRREVKIIEQADPVDISEPWTMLAHKKPQHGWVAYNPKTMRPPLSRDTKFLKLMSWNVNGLRALLKMDSFSMLQQREDFDILCLQETKLQEKDVQNIKQQLFDGYENSYWACSISKLGYSGVAIISRIKPISVRYGLGILDHDSEGRILTLEFDKFFLISGYVPNSGDGLRRLGYRINEWDLSLGNHLKDLEKKKPVILTGDLNCAHEEIDIYNPAGNRRSAGFTDEERKSFEMNFLLNGFVDTFRNQHPGVVGYTYYGYRHGGRKTNKGWRLDYFLVSESLADQVYDSYIVPDILGSDHCPIGLILKQ